VKSFVQIASKRFIVRRELPEFHCWGYLMAARVGIGSFQEL